MNLRLFALRVNATGKILPDLYFPNKPAAKKHRDANGGATKFSVTPGPDHRNFKQR